MHQYSEILDVYAREILDSRGNPTVEVEVLTEDGTVGRASVPSGASTGQYEAVELRDGGERYGGKGVQNAVEHVNTILADCIIGENIYQQAEIDRKLIRADGSENKSHLGANAILGVSMAVAHAAAKSLEIPLFRYLGGSQALRLPVPMFNVINGGCHTRSALDFQEFMLMPVQAESFSEGLRMAVEIYHQLRRLLDEAGLSVAVGDEGGFAPDLSGAEEAFDYLNRAVKAAGYVPGEEIRFAMDAAASELWGETRGAYYFPGESRMKGKEILRDTEEMIRYYQTLSEGFALWSIEDGLDENDWEGWGHLSAALGKNLQLVGDDLFVTNAKRLKKGIRLGAANAVLVKVNQIGTLTEAFETMELAEKNGYRFVVPTARRNRRYHRADIAVASGAGQIKTGAPAAANGRRSTTIFFRIEDFLGGMAKYRVDNLSFLC